MRNLLYLLIIVAIGLGCKKSERDEDILTNTSEENAYAESLYADVYKMVHNAAMKTKGISSSLTTDTTLFGCDILTADTSVTPKLLTIDFRFSGCVATHGISRKGKIIAEFTGHYPDSNSIINIQFLNYNFGKYKVNGNISIVNRGRNALGNQIITFFMQDGTIVEDRSTIRWQANKSWEYTKGATTTTFSDDEYLVTGTSFGYNGNGNEYDSEVIIPNRITTECFQITAGNQIINVKNLSTRTIDYGNGACDRDAIVNINGEEVTVKLRQ